MDDPAYNILTALLLASVMHCVLVCVLVMIDLSWYDHNDPDDHLLNCL